MTIDTHGRAHKPAGSPASTGGQYAQQATPNQASALSTERQPWISEDSRSDWGAVDTAVGGRSPWGEIDNVSGVAPGIVFASTASHGGYRLSPERNQFVPSHLRQMSRWYEEDSAYPILARTFPGAMRDDQRDSLEAVFEDADEMLRDNEPDAWEQITGRTIQPGESRRRDQAIWKAKNTERVQVNHSGRPVNGFVTVRGRYGGKSVLMRIPADVYAREEQARKDAGADGTGTFADEQYIVPTPEAPRFEERRYAIDHDTITGKAAEYAGKRYRDRDGNIVTELELIERRGITGRRMAADGTKRAYYVDHPDGITSQVPKALWDALPGPIADPTQTELNIERHKLEGTVLKLTRGRRWGSLTPEETRKVTAARERLQQMGAESNEEWERSRAHFTEANARREAMTTEADFYADYQAAIDAAAPWTTNGIASPDVPDEVRQRIKDLTTWGRDHKMLG